MLYISRHGLRLDKVIKRHKGNPDPPIHQSGIGKLIENSKKIESLDAIFCSPFLRCVQTAHYLNRHDAPIYIEYGMSETLRERWYEKCGYNPLNRLVNSHDLNFHYYNVDVNYDSAIRQTFPESRRDSRARNKQFIKWLKSSPFWEKNILLVGHGFSVKDSLNNLGVNPPYQGWSGGFPSMGHLFTVDNEENPKVDLTE